MTNTNSSRYATDLATVDLASTPFTWTTLTRIANTDIVPGAFRGKPDTILAAVYMGRELGLAPMQSLNMIDVIDGKPSLSSELQTAMIRGAGHSLQCVDMSDEVVTVKGTRCDNDDEMTVSFTWSMAERAQLINKSNWVKYPEAMMWARSVSMLARMLFADVFAVVHALTPDELGDGIEHPSVDPASALPLDAEIIEAQSAEPEAEMDRNSLEVRLAELLGAKPDGTMDDIEGLLRALVRVAERLGVVSGRDSRDFLHAALHDVGARHVSDLRRTELVMLYESLRSEIASKFVTWIHDDDSEMPDPSGTHVTDMVQLLGEVLGAVEVDTEQDPQ